MEILVPLLSAAVSSTLPMALSAISQKLKTRHPAAVRSLQTELGLIKDVIEKDGLSSGEALIGALRILAYDIEDCIERFLHHVLSDGEETKKTSEEFANDIGELKKRSEELHKRLRTSGNAGASSSAGGVPTTIAQTFCDPPVGMVEPIRELKELLEESGSELERKLKVISIVGFGGLGKTRLAQQVYKDVRNQFPLHAWVHAAGKGPHEVLEEILEQFEAKSKAVHDGSTSDNGKYGASTHTSLLRFGFDLFRRVPSKDVEVHNGKGEQEEIQENGVPDASTSTMDRLIGRLKPFLETNRYLIVIVEMRDDSLWGDINPAFPRANGVDSRIIVTTTIRSIAKGCSSGDGHVYQMSTLSAENSKELFSKLFQGVAESSEVVKKCDGLPLALICAAQFLNGKGLERSEEAFHKICAQEEVQMNSLHINSLQRMQRVLGSNYEALSGSSMHLCLLYFCMFPLDHHIRRNSLLRRWLAEGIIPRSRLGEAVSNLEVLIDHNIIQPMEVSTNGNVKRCKPPGMMLEYISRKSRSQDFVTVYDETAQEPQHDARRLSLHPKGATGRLDLPEAKDSSRLRTLAVFPIMKEGEATVDHANDEAISSIAVHKLLRVLDLKECEGLSDKGLKKICNKLLLLKYLSLGGSVSKVPKEIKKLVLLETLDLRRRNEIVLEVPLQVILLPKLRNLLGKFQLNEDGIRRRNPLRRGMIKETLVNFLSTESNLEILSGFVTGSSQGFPQLMLHMRKLSKVKIWYCYSTANEASLADLPEAVKKFIGSTAGRSLSIDFTECSTDRSKTFLDLVKDSDTKKNSPATPPPKIQSRIKWSTLDSVKLRGKLSRFPAFVTQLSITELCLSSTALQEHIMLGGLNRLKDSSLKYLKLVEDNLGPLEIQLENFPSLERMCLVGEESLHDITIQAGLPQDTPPLFSLHILCDKLGDLPGIQIRSLPSLKEVGLHSGVTDEIKGNWQAAARSHPNWPNLVFIGPPKSRDQDPQNLPTP